MANLISALDPPVRALREFASTLTFSCLGRRRRSIPRLPVEVCEFIIGFVGYLPEGEWWYDGLRESQITLCSCILVCRDWVPKSRIHLYEYLHLDNKRTATKFTETLMAFPLLGKYARWLMIDAHNQHDDWFYKVHQDLPLLLPNLTHLFYHKFPAVHPLFFVLSRGFNFVTHLGLLNMGSWSLRETTRFLSGFTQLQELMIDISQLGTVVLQPLYCRKIHGQAAARAIGTELIAAYMGTPLAARDYTALFDWFRRSHFDYSLLALDLHISDLSYATENLDDLVVRASETVESMTLSLEWSNFNNSSPMWIPPIAIYSKLQWLDVYLDNWRVKQGKTLARQFLESLLPCLPTSLCGIKLRFNGDASSVFTAGHGNFWKAFDNTLSSPKFPQLTSVELLWWEPTAKALASTLSELAKKRVFMQLIPGIYRRNILDCGRFHTTSVPVRHIPFTRIVMHTLELIPWRAENVTRILSPSQLKSDSRS